MRPFLVAALAAASQVPALSPAAAQQTISKDELGSTEPAEMHRRIRDLVWDLVEVKDFRAEPRDPKIVRSESLTSLGLQTKVMPGATRGLCRRQFLSVRLGHQPGTSDPPRYKATSLNVHTQFHFFQPPSGVYASSWYQYAPNPECEGLPAGATFFHADNEQAAHDGILYFLQAQAAARAGALRIECDEIIRDNYKTDCRDDVLKLQLRNIDSIAGCDEIKAEDCISVIDLVNARRFEFQMGGSPWRPIRLRVGFFASVTTAGG